MKKSIQQFAVVCFVTYVAIITAYAFYFYTHSFFGCHWHKYLEDGYWVCSIIHTILPTFLGMFVAIGLGYLFVCYDEKYSKKKK